MPSDVTSNGRKTATERFWLKVEKTESCWLWTGAKTQMGYGRFWHEHRLGSAHRWAYEQLVGSIPVDLELDHLCRTHNCVNPNHLEAVTHAENVRRGKLGVFNGSKTHCPNGHEYTESNTYSYPGRRNRACRSCRSTQGEIRSV